jgi:hypothetical protein
LNPTVSNKRYLQIARRTVTVREPSACTRGMEAKILGEFVKILRDVNNGNLDKREEAR